MPKILFFLLLLCIKENTSFKSNTKNKIIVPSTTQTFEIKYETKTYFNFEDIKESELQVNIHSINCKIEANLDEQKLDNTNSELFYFKVNSNNKNISVTPLVDIVEGEPKENYTIKYCHLTISSYYISDNTLQKLKIENKEENFIYFDNPIYEDTFNLFYEIKKVSENSFISLFFRYEKEASFDIDISYTNNKNKKNSTFKTIEKTSFIYLNSEFLLYDNTDDNDNGILSINIKNISIIDKSMPKSMFFKIIEENNTCLLEKDTLNFGFITSKSTYQYYYMDILPGKEGELMLHNKRNYGILHAIIVEKK